MLVHVDIGTLGCKMQMSTLCLVIPRCAAKIDLMQPSCKIRSNVNVNPDRNVFGYKIEFELSTWDLCTTNRVFLTFGEVFEIESKFESKFFD